MTDWHVSIEYDGLISEDQGTELVERAGQFVVVTLDGERNRTRASLGVEASTLRQATDEAWRRARQITAGIVTGQPVALRIITDAELAAELERPAVPDLVDTAAARELLGINTQQRMSEIEQREDFPEPVAVVSGGRRIYTRASIEAFGQRWDRRPGRPRKTTKSS